MPVEVGELDGQWRWESYVPNMCQALKPSNPPPQGGGGAEGAGPAGSAVQPGPQALKPYPPPHTQGEGGAEGSGPAGAPVHPGSLTWLGWSGGPP